MQCGTATTMSSAITLTITMPVLTLTTILMASPKIAITTYSGNGTTRGENEHEDYLDQRKWRWMQPSHQAATNETHYSVKRSPFTSDIARHRRDMLPTAAFTTEDGMPIAVFRSLCLNWSGVSFLFLRKPRS